MEEHLNELKGSVNGFGSKMDILSEVAKSEPPKENGIIILVEFWGGGLRELEHQQRVVYG